MGHHLACGASDAAAAAAADAATTQREQQHSSEEQTESTICPTSFGVASSTARAVEVSVRIDDCLNALTAFDIAFDTRLSELASFALTD